LFLSALSSGEGADIAEITNTPEQTCGSVDMPALASMPEVEFFPAQNYGGLLFLRLPSPF